MESIVKMDVPMFETTKRLSSLSIVVDDFDREMGTLTSEMAMPEKSIYQPPPKPYTRQTSDAMIQKILDEAEDRKHAFWKLIDEHNAVVENLKRMEQSDSCCKVTATQALRT